MSTQLIGSVMVGEGDLTSNTATPLTSVGTMIHSYDGRSFRYCQAGSVALVPGKLYQSPATVTANQTLAVAAAAVGATSVTTTTTVTVTANQYAGGWVMVTVTPGQGYQYRIKSHPAATAAALTLTLEDPIVVALTTASRIDLVANPYMGVLLSLHTSQSGNPIGVPTAAVSANNYGWVQTHGACCVLADDPVTVDTSVVVSDTVDGAITPIGDAPSAPIVGHAMEAIADTQYGAVFLTID